MATFRTLKDMPELRGKRVLVRAEFNVPVKDGKAGDRFRIESAVPTLQYLSDRGAKVIVCAHLGRKPEESLVPVYEVLRELMPQARFVSDLVGEEARRAIAELPEGGVLLLENLRRDAGEQENGDALSESLASLADLYVNDAFGVCHRPAASVVGVPARIPGFAGLLLERELTKLAKGLAPESPSLLILGGAKFETKEPLLKSSLPRYDHIFIGGALANDFLRAQGLPIGKSLVSDGDPALAELLASGKLLLPVDVTVETPQGVQQKAVQNVGPEDRIVDVGPESVTALGVHIARAAFVLWNGPLGLYEGGFTQGTQSVAQLVADSSAQSIVGGGDTVAAIRTLHLEEKFSFMSTGGGAMLDYLVDGTLPGVTALERSPAA